LYNTIDSPHDNTRHDLPPDFARTAKDKHGYTAKLKIETRFESERIVNTEKTMKRHAYVHMTLMRSRGELRQVEAQGGARKDSTKLKHKKIETTS